MLFICHTGTITYKNYPVSHVVTDLFVCRVKALDSFEMNGLCVLVTASNDGFIKLWDFSAEVRKHLTVDANHAPEPVNPF